MPVEILTAFLNFFSTLTQSISLSLSFFICLPTREKKEEKKSGPMLSLDLINLANTLCIFFFFVSVEIISHSWRQQIGSQQDNEKKSKRVSKTKRKSKRAVVIVNKNNEDSSNEMVALDAVTEIPTFIFLMF